MSHGINFDSCRAHPGLYLQAFLQHSVGDFNVEAAKRERGLQYILTCMIFMCKKFAWI